MLRLAIKYNKHPDTYVYICEKKKKMCSHMLALYIMLTFTFLDSFDPPVNAASEEEAKLLPENTAVAQRGSVLMENVICHQGELL